MPSFTTDQLNSLLNQALTNLKKDRDREVLIRRGGIGSANQTLEQIGQDLNITRERVRQIEKAALARIREQHKHDHEFTAAVVDILSKQGGIINLAFMAEELGMSDSQLPYAIFLIKINPKIIFLDRNDHHACLVADSQRYNTETIKSLHKALVEAVTQHGKPAKFENIISYIDGIHSPAALKQLATASNYITHYDSYWGLVSWPEVNPKSIRDKIFLVLKKTKRPMHFTEIAEKVTNLQANPKKVTTQAVHNELIKDNRFVLIGRGIYALSEWGYKAGTVADIIEEILREDSPLTRDEIIKRVLARRQVKTTTIVLNLQEKPQFKRVDKGVYTLAKAKN